MLVDFEKGRGGCACTHNKRVLSQQTGFSGVSGQDRGSGNGGAFLWIRRCGFSVSGLKSRVTAGVASEADVEVKPQLICVVSGPDC